MKDDAPQDGPKDERAQDDAGDGGDERDAKTKWAEDRTDWAEDRTLLANERTYAGWLRTGAACVAVALGLKAVFEETDPVWLAKGVSTAFLLAAVGIFVSAAQQSHKAQSRIRQHDTEATPPWRMVVLAAALVLATIATGVILWTL